MVPKSCPGGAPTMSQIMPPPSPSAPSSGLQTLGVGAGLVVAVAALYVGAGIFVPLVLAVLLTFALAPVVRFLRRLKLPHIVAVLLSVLGAALIIGGIAFLMVTQLARLAGDLPQYQQTIGDKVRTLQTSAGGGDAFERIASAIQQFGADASAARSLTEEVEPGQPVPVTIQAPPTSPLNFVQGFLGSILGPLATAAIVTVFVVFLLLEREDFRDRFLKLVSRGDLRTTTKVMNEAAKRVSRYLLLQVTVNLSYGAVFGLGLFMIGIPNAVLWGMFAALFRYIPFVGTLIAATIPFALAFAVDPGWSMLIQAVALYAALELIITNAVEPRLYGNSTGLSALAVIVAAMFWATLWGPIGLILATPLTVCLVVLGRYVPQLAFLETLLGSDPVLVREERLYQRLLSGNEVEAIDMAEAFLEEGTATEFYDNIAIPALRLAEHDRERNATDLTNRRQVVSGMASVIAEVDELERERADADAEVLPASDRVVLCIGGQTELDGAASEMVSQSLAGLGVTARTMPPMAVRQESINQIDLEGVDVVCLTYLGRNPRSFARFVARRLKRRAPHVRILACLFTPTDGTSAEDLRRQTEVDAVVGTVAAARRQIGDWLGNLDAVIDLEAAQKLLDRAEVLHKLTQMTGEGGRLDGFAADVATQFEAALALVSLPQTEKTELAQLPGMESKMSLRSLTDVVLATGQPLIIPDVAEDTNDLQDGFLLENGIQFYAAVPLTTASGAVVGVLSLLDNHARPFQDEDVEALRAHGRRLVAEVEDGVAEQPAPPTGLMQVG